VHEEISMLMLTARLVQWRQVFRSHLGTASVDDTFQDHVQKDMLRRLDIKPCARFFWNGGRA
jgi:hypothetical protein